MTQDDLPYLWHYTTQRNLLKIMDSRRLWATDILYLSDSTEFTYAVDLCLFVLRDFSPEQQALLRSALDPIKEGLTWEVSFRIFVTSFSENGDLLSQWRAYSDTGGFSLAFESAFLRTLGSLHGFRLVKCEYDRAIQEKLMRELIEEVLGPKEGEENTPEKRQLRCRQRISQLAPSIKHPSFSEEKEWRLVSNFIPVKYSDTKYRAGRSMLTPYVEIPLAEDGAKLPIKLVQIGPTPHPDLAWLSANFYLESRIEGPGTFMPVFARYSTQAYRTW